MKVRLPYSRTKRYLTGMDWVVAALEESSHRETGGSNASQIVMELSGPFDDARFAAAVEAIGREHPVLSGSVRRDWNLAPYWHIPRCGRSIPVRIRTIAEEALSGMLVDSINEPFPGKREHLAFRVFHMGSDRHVVAMCFGHRLLDAQGGESFLNVVNEWTQDGGGGRERLARARLDEPAHLDDWRRRFEVGRPVVRLIRELAGMNPAVLPRPAPLRGRTFRFRVMPFDERQTADAIQRAYREAGYLMFMPYALTAASEALHAVFAARGLEERDYLVSVSVSTRKPETSDAALLFNHLSFMFFRIAAASLRDRRQTLESVRSQMYEQIKADLPGCLAESGMLMRIVPLRILSRMMGWPMRGELSSYAFTSVGKGGYPCARFMEADVVNLYHMPLVPVPPGLGFVVNQFGNRINAVLSYVDGLLSEEEADRIEQEFRSRL